MPGVLDLSFYPELERKEQIVGWTCFSAEQTKRTGVEGEEEMTTQDGFEIKIDYAM
jgi:hypothetical protein